MFALNWCIFASLNFAHSIDCKIYYINIELMHYILDLYHYHLLFWASSPDDEEGIIL